MTPSGRRIADALFGAFFCVLGVAIAVVGDGGAGPLMAALVVGGLGLQALLSALRGRRSWLSRIGPLP